jgi:choline dehydrogenase-like flavoprotein
VSDYDVIIIGTGAGGGTLVSRLAPSGKRILVLERGGFLPRERANWDTVQVFQHDRYHTDEVWHDRRGAEIRPGTGYWVGGNTKVYGAALFRMRERDFEEVSFGAALSPAWPVGYRDFEPYYTQAERLYQVRGEAGVDPTEPYRGAPFAHGPVPHEPRIQELHDALHAHGLHPFHVPLGVRMEADRLRSPCIRCDTCDGFPCLLDAKADADVTCVRPAAALPNVHLVTGARVTRLGTSATGREVTTVEALIDGAPVRFRGDVAVVACGAINSAALLLRSKTGRHPDGLANGSGLVGRNFMKHHNGAVMAVSTKPNPTSFQKTLAINDFYWGEPGAYELPMGHVSLLGKVNRDMLAAEAPGFAPGVALDKLARHSVDWWLTAEDLPHADNRVRVTGAEGERIVLDYTDRHTEGFERLMKRWCATLEQVDGASGFFPSSVYFRKKIPLAAVGHQCGTVRFGSDPRTSVLDPSCRAHEVDNLYVVDGSFFPSSAAVNPSLTIMANALRVGDILLGERL